ncbi:hypothetical protein FHS29_006762 [Saccharothrix tamanrassetensis]|uniref:Uncharacterized protein n=1 Tax=Saccharothrix tamanrassetensis TaxID=1051531 RepID=A0A841CS60_9PSEU|nr:hypothetical protein [Saccharothrix tamanrassetensis]
MPPAPECTESPAQNNRRRTITSSHSRRCPEALHTPSGHRPLSPHRMEYSGVARLRNGRLRQVRHDFRHNAVWPAVGSSAFRIITRSAPSGDPGTPNTVLHEPRSWGERGSTPGDGGWGFALFHIGSTPPTTGIPYRADSAIPRNGPTTCLLGGRSSSRRRSGPDCASGEVPQSRLTLARVGESVHGTPRPCSTPGHSLATRHRRQPHRLRPAYSCPCVSARQLEELCRALVEILGGPPVRRGRPSPMAPHLTPPPHALPPLTHVNQSNAYQPAHAPDA